ncbi:exported hypothetical protein [metagenome]|uniref:Putative Flp pilus-assembly TadG-like N-terminal domain-containing protein n=1 Tax=metagenome TaxID=256318 RepID=A0A2P2CD33_9ZZZZ
MSAARGPRRTKDEGGAVAVLFALLTLVLFGVAALGVDMGSMYQRKAETQSQADLAAMSGAPALASSSVVATAHANAVAKVRSFLVYNSKLGQAGGLTTAMLTDGNDANGEVTFPSTYTMKVVSPYARVDFTLAGAMGLSHADVAGTATVGVGTPGATAVMPFYAVSGSGCDYGAQSLTDPANGKKQSIVPTLAPPATNVGQTSNASLTTVTPYAFPVGVAATITAINGSQLSSVNKIGFFRSPTETPNAVEQVITSNTNNNMISTVAIPTVVTDNAGVWWIRTYTATGNKGWSPIGDSLPIRIGDGPIQCGAASNSGNFGTLKLARSSSPSTWAPDNMAVGLQSPLSLTAQTNPLSIPLCVVGGPSVTYTATTGSATRYAQTNCVDTDTGLTSLVTTQGLVTGTGSGYPGRLVKSTTTGVAGRQCGVNHTSSQRVQVGFSLNDDTLSCFMSDPTMPLSTIGSPTYSAGAALDPAIYSSPRFCYVPVLAVDPSNGGSLHYSIVDMRPCFITSEDNTSTYNSQKFVAGGTVSTTTTTNGLTVTSGKVTTLQVYFFNKSALPSTGDATAGVILSPDGPLVPVLTN